MKKLFFLSATFALTVFLASCQKEVGSGSSSSLSVSDENLVCEADQFNPWAVNGNYIVLETNTKVMSSDSNGRDGHLYSFTAPAGMVVIKEYEFRIDVNDGSKPIIALKSEDTYYATQIIKKGKNVLATGSNVIFAGMKDTVSSNKSFNFEIIYSKIAQNGVTAGKTTVKTTLVRVTYEKAGQVKTIYPNLSDRPRMMVSSMLGPYDPEGAYANPRNTWVNHKLTIGRNFCFRQKFFSLGGDNLLQEIPLKFLGGGYNMGTIPKIWVSVYDDSLIGPATIVPASVTSVGNSTFVIKLPQSYLNKRSRIIDVDFFVEIQGITNSASLYTGLGNLKYFKWTEIQTGKVYTIDNETYMWEYLIWQPWYPYVDYGAFFWKLDP